MKSRILAITLISLIVLTSCTKDSSMGSLETSIVEQKISSTDINSSDNSFSLEIPLKTKGGKDFIIEEGGKFRLNSINVIEKQKDAVTSGSESNKNPVFEVKNEGSVDYVEIPQNGLLITKKVKSSGVYKIDVRLKSGALKATSTLDFSFSVKKSTDSDVVEFKKQIMTQSNISAKPETAAETNQVKDDEATKIDKPEGVEGQKKEGDTSNTSPAPAAEKTVSTPVKAQTGEEVAVTEKKEQV